MVRNELISKLKNEILHYVGVPYWKNTLQNGVIIKSGIFGGKGTCEQIAAKTIELAQKQKIDLLALSPQKIYNFQKKNKLGIDCSGLTSNLLNLILRLEKIEFQINQFKTSANALTSEPLSQEIKNIDDIQTGDMIRLDNGHHVIFVIEKINDVIFCVQSSRKTSFHGVQYTRIEITDPKKPLDQQLWSETYPGKFEGVFRLKELVKKNNP